MYAFRRGETWFYEFQHEHRRIRRGGFPTKTLAKLAGDADLRKHREQRIERIWGVKDERRRPTMPTLAEYVRDSYVTHHLPRLEPSTQKTARSQLKALTRHLGRSRLDALAPEVLDAYVTARLVKVSSGQVREEVARLSRVLNHARSRTILTAHPFRGWKRPRAVPRDYRLVMPSEERQLLDRAPRDFADWIAVALDTGLRKGELRILESQGLALNREIRLLQPKVKRTKVIPLTPRALSIVLSRKKVGQYLFGQPNGRPYSLPWIDRMWARTLRRAKLGGIRFQDLRHTFASRLADAGVSVPVVGELLGHKPPYTTTLRYFHALPEAKRAAILKLPTLRNAPRKRARAG